MGKQKLTLKDLRSLMEAILQDGGSLEEVDLKTLMSDSTVASHRSIF